MSCAVRPVVRRGEVVELGTHSELVVIPSGAYATLVRLQQQRAQAGTKDAGGLVRGGHTTSLSLSAKC